jgi:phosphoglycerate dehydrogenase-like enzyme
VIVTPHVAAASREAGDDLRRRAGEQVLAMLEESGRLQVGREQGGNR